MTERPNDSRIVDVSTFTRVAGQREGQCKLAEFERLNGSLLSAVDSVPATWAVQGEQRPVTGGAPEMWLHLQGRAQVALQCQRCLQAVEVDLEVDRHFRFVRYEAEAARLDEESEDDVLVLEPRLDLLELLEDEFILALPIVPMHEVCPQPLKAPVGEVLDDEPAPNPFAALAALRKKSTDEGD